MPNRHLIILPINEDWDHTADFLRQTALTLSNNHRIIIYDQKNAYFFLKKKPKIIYPQHHNISFYQVKYFLPFRRWMILEKLNRLFSFWLLLLRYHFEKKIIWIFSPNYHDLARVKDKRTIRLYDCVDYCSDSDKETKLIKNVDYFFVNSLVLEKLHEDKKAIYIDSQGFFLPEEKGAKVTKTKRKQPVIGYVGGINYRLNFPLIYKLITKHPHWQFVFYGPKQKYPKEDILFKTDFFLNKIEQLPNVTFGQSKNRYQVYELIKKIDIAIIPYNQKIVFNQYCYPMKIFEYLYFKKPVVSANIQELGSHKFKNIVKIARTDKDWSQMIQSFLQNPPSTFELNQGKQLAIYNSWQEKINKILNYVWHQNRN